jgi:hypothetical protein
VSNTEILIVSGFGAIYIALMLTLAVTTYRKGHFWLFGIGFLVPVLWLVGALLKPKPESKAAQQERERWQSNG